MKSPTGSVKKRKGKKKRLARLTYNYDSKCGKHWGDPKRACPWCGNTDPASRRRRDRRQEVDTANAGGDLVRRWRDQLKKSGTLDDPDPAAPAQSTVAAPTSHTFDDLCTLFNEKYAIPAQYNEGIKVAGMRAHRTFRIHVEHLRRELRLENGQSIPLAELSFGHLYDARLKLLGGLTPAGKPRTAMYVNRVMSTCRLMLKVARLRNLMTHTPFTADPSVRLVDKRHEKNRDRVVSYEEEVALLAACTADKMRLHLRLAVVMAVETGMRQREILKTQRWPTKDLDGYDMPHVDWILGAIHVSAHYSKTGRARIVPMSARVKEEIRRWESLLPPRDSALFHVETIDTGWRGARRDAKVKGVRFHDLKHTFVTRAELAGVPGDLISLMADHGDQKAVESKAMEEMTRRTYLNFNDDLQKLVVSRLDAQWMKITSERQAVN